MTGDHSLERTVFFSDAVIAIAMTLLALELPVPNSWDRFVEHFDEEYVAFIISFVVTASFWFSHHRLFGRIGRLSRPLNALNMLSLFAIVLVPFAARVISESKGPFGPVFYACVMVLFGIAYTGMVLAAQRGHLWREDTPPTAVTRMLWGAGVPFGIFALSIPLAFVRPSVAEYSWLLIPFVTTAVGRLRRRLATT